MGAPAGQTTGSQVFYDPDTQQYYTINQTKQSNPMLSAFSNIFGSEKNRNYINIPSMNAADRFTPKYVPATYPEMSMLFPALDIGLAQNIQNSLLEPTDSKSSGAGRFLVTSTSKGKQI